MQLVDTHCHIHESDKLLKMNDDETRKRWKKAEYPTVQALIAQAAKADVTHMICVGCSLDDSKRAVALAPQYDELLVSIGIHPHEAQKHVDQPQSLADFAALATSPKVVAVGECGLDYYYQNSPKDAQEKVLRFQIELALQHDLPMIFHVRDAFDDFWTIFDEYEGIRGVIHSFSAGPKELEQILARGLYVGLNGIMTFTKSDDQLNAAKAVPLHHLLLETDAPFLTPAPYRGTICEPKHVRVTAEFLAELRGETLADIAKATTHNAQMLFDF